MSTDYTLVCPDDKHVLHIGAHYDLAGMFESCWDDEAVVTPGVVATYTDTRNGEWRRERIRAWLGARKAPVYLRHEGGRREWEAKEASRLLPGWSARCLYGCSHIYFVGWDEPVDEPAVSPTKPRRHATKRRTRARS